MTSAATYKTKIKMIQKCLNCWKWWNVLNA